MWSDQLDTFISRLMSNGLLAEDYLVDEKFFLMGLEYHMDTKGDTYQAGFDATLSAASNANMRFLF